MAVIKSGDSTDTLHINSDKSANVTVVNFPGTQPISGAVSVSNFPSTQNVAVTSSVEVEVKNDSGNAIPISATNLDVALSTRLKPTDTLTKVTTVDTITNPVAVTGTFFQATQPVSGSVSVSNFPASTEISNDLGNPIPTTASDTLTKGTQGSTGFSVQELKDAGRAIKTYSAIAIAGVTTEALISLTSQTDGTNGTAGTSFTVTAGKRLRLQSLICSARTGAAAANWSRFVLRMSASGAVTTASPVLAIVEMPAPAATSGIGSPPAPISLADGIDLTGTMQFGVTHNAAATTNIESVSVIGFEY